MFVAAVRKTQLCVRHNLAVLERIVESTMGQLVWHKSMTITKRVKNALKISPKSKHKVEHSVKKTP